MKKLFLAGAIALCGAANAQIGEGTMFITGNVGYSGNKVTTSSKIGSVETKTDNFSVVPVFGYFVAPNLAVGLGVGYAATTNEPGTNYDKETTSAFVVEPLLRKYWNVSNNFLLFGQLSVPMSFGTFKGEDKGQADDKGTINTFGVVIRPGIDYVIAPNWTVEATIGEFGYRNTTAKPDNNPGDVKVKTDNYNFGLNFGSLTFGVKYLFK